ncbi:MAG: membrane protein of unknown function [Promethearchaeota archaeon]|nr:MAG: membrane protein of unknown function [Candidatus Lokiarchaeota archaeon]
MCENCLGLIIISIVCFGVGIVLIKNFSLQRNVFTLYIALFFILNGFGYLIWFLSTEWIFDVYGEMKNFILLIGFLPQIVLLYFILSFYEVRLYIRITIIIAATVLSTLDLFIPLLRIYIFDPSFRLYFIISSIIYTANIVLFLRNWRRNNDLNSLFFSLGLFFNMIAMIFNYFSKSIQGVLLMITASIWAITYSNIIDVVFKDE